MPLLLIWYIVFFCKSLLSPFPLLFPLTLITEFGANVFGCRCLFIYANLYGKSIVYIENATEKLKCNARISIRTQQSTPNKQNKPQKISNTHCISLIIWFEIFFTAFCSLTHYLACCSCIFYFNVEMNESYHLRYPNSKSIKVIKYSPHATTF